MSKKIKILLSLTVFMVALSVGLYVVIVKTIQPEKIKALVIKIIEENLPRTQVAIGSIDYSIGLSIKLDIQDFQIKLKDEGTDLFKVQSVVVDIPLWAIITQGGNLNIAIKDPILSYLDLSETKNNWLYALSLDQTTPAADSTIGEETKNEIAAANTAANDGKMIKGEIPQFIEQSKLHLRIENLNVIYTPFGKPESKIILSKILLKDIGLKTATAFEIDSSLTYALKENDYFRGEMLLIGQVDVPKFLEDKSLNAEMRLSLKKLKLDSLDAKIPDVQQEISVKMAGKNINANVKIKAEDVLDMKFEANMVDKFLKIQNLDFVFNIYKATDVMPSLADKLKAIKLNAAKFELTGSVDFDLANKILNPDLIFSVKNPIDFETIENVVLKNTVKGFVKGKNVEVEAKTDVLEGVIISKVQTQVDPLNQQFDLPSLSPIYVDVKGSNLRIAKAFIHKLLYSKKEGVAPAENNPAGTTTVGAGTAGTAAAPTEPEAPIVLPQVSFKLDLNQFFIADEVLNLQANINAKGSNAKSEKLHFTFGKGNGDISFNTELKSTQRILNQFTFTLKDLNLDAFNSFLPPLLSGVGGTFKGKVNGDVNLLPAPIKLQYNIKADVTALKGEFKDLDLAKFILPVIDGIALLKGKVKKEDLVLSNGFDTLAVKVDATQDKVTIHKFEFMGPPLSLDLKAHGYVSMKETSPSQVDAEYFDKTGKLTPYLAMVKYKSIPLRLVGNGFIILPDYNYTLQKMSGTIIDAELKKHEAILKEKLKVETDKLKAQVEVKKKEVEKEVNKKKKEAEKKIKKDLENEAKKALKGLIP